LEAISAAAAQFGQSIAYSLNDWDIPAAVAVARDADVAIVFTVADSGEGYITVDKNEGDRNNLSVWNNGDNLISAVAAVNSHTIVVLHVVGPVLMPWANNPNITAIVLAGLPGQESGNALADVLFGNVVAQGKLVYTIAKNANDYPAQVLYNSTAAHPQIPYKEGLFIDYRWFDENNIQPLYEFGFGLSYTTFAYSNLQIQKASQQKDTPKKISSIADTIAYKVQASITNSGSTGGYEIAQLYLGFPESANEPPKVLKGFEKIWLNSNQTVPVVFYLYELDISIWDVNSQNWIIPKGEFVVYVGASSRDIRLKGNFTQ